MYISVHLYIRINNSNILEICWYLITCTASKIHTFKQNVILKAHLPSL